MIKSPVLLGLAALLAAGATFAANATAAEAVPPTVAAPPAKADDAARRLEEARTRLDAAAREVAELSMLEGGGPGGAHTFNYRTDGGRRAILGVQVGEGGGADSKNGAKLVAVSPGGPAEAAGLKAGDVVVGIQGVDLRGKDNAERELVQQMRAVKPDQKVKLKVQRNGKVQDFEVTARAAPPRPMFMQGGGPGGGRGAMGPGSMGPGSMGPGSMGPGSMGMSPGMLLDMDDDGMPGVIGALLGRPGMLGLELATLTPKLGQYFGVDKGVLVLKAPEANKLQLEEGDVILAIDGREPSNSSHAARILRSYQPGEKLKLRVQRQRKTLTLDGEIAPQPPARHDRMRGTPMPPAGMFDIPVPPPPPGAAPRIEQKIVIRSRDEERT